ncbi:fibro-slime domain-containing protein [Fibrobacter sp.]|uniref:fibro-slime domain-containing protein n=1 Tax=Fibrobacter sp. TaxID=35828 RepID=UPI003869965B
MRNSWRVAGLSVAIPLLAFVAGCSENPTSQLDEPGKNPASHSGDESSFETLLCSSPVGGAVTPEPEYLNVGSMTAVIRDFQPNHSDFENFSEEATTQLEYESIAHLDLIYNYVTRTGVAMKDNGYGDDWYTAVPYHASCGTVSANAKYGSGTQIGVDGLPMDENTNLPEYLRQTSAGPVLEYGECNFYKKYESGQMIVRGYKNALEGIDYYSCEGGKTNWANPVIATTGMVSPYLTFAKAGADGKIDMIDGVTISKLNERCDNANFDQWFTDVPSVNKRVNTTLNLIKDPESDDYIYSRGYNNGGFFPLDSINPSTREWVMNKPCDPSIQPNGMCEQYEPQSLSIYCPPYDYQYARTQSDEFQQNTYELCDEWLNQGGPRAADPQGTGYSAAWLAMVSMANRGAKIGMQHLRNFHFTMMAYSTFKYDAAKQATAPQNFEFISSGDMWVFVDGVLVADMGGDHMPVPSIVNLQVLAANNHGCHDGEPLATYENCKGSSENAGWADGSVHHLHIFYANRQTNGSEIYIRAIPEKRATRRVEPLSMNKFEVVKDAHGNTQNRISMNLPFADSTVKAVTSQNIPSMIVLRDDADGKTKALGLYLLSLTGPTASENGEQVYQFEGVLRDIDGNTVEGGLRSLDRIAFNVPWSKALENGSDSEMYVGDVWAQMMAWSKMMPTYIASSSGKQIVTFTANNALNKLINSCAE